MAKLIKETQRHNCHEEIARDLEPPNTTPLYLGSIVECSCGKRFTKCDDQRDGPYWSEGGYSPDWTDR